MRWQKLTLEEQRDVDKCKGLFESHYESLSQAYGETVTLKGLRDALKAIQIKEVEAVVNAQSSPRSGKVKTQAIGFIRPKKKDDVTRKTKTVA